MEFSDDFLAECVNTATPTTPGCAGEQPAKMKMAWHLLQDILKIRRGNGWSHAYIADKAGMTDERFVSRMEDAMVAGEMPTWRMLHRYANVLNRDVEIMIAPAGNNSITLNDAERLAKNLFCTVENTEDSDTYRLKPDPSCMRVKWGMVNYLARELNSEIKVVLLAREQ